jgi:hypothetical protein
MASPYNNLILTIILKGIFYFNPHSSYEETDTQLYKLIKVKTWHKNAKLYILILSKFCIN